MWANRQRVISGDCGSVRQFGLEAKDRGVFRARANDSGGVLFDKIDMRFLARVVAVAENIANPKLKPPQCIS
eukprot:8993943-Pyramimonas_sp.AAC.1